MKKTIVFTSRDVGAANQILPIAKRFMTMEEFNTHIIASKPGYDVFINEGMQVTKFSGHFEGDIDQHDYLYNDDDERIHRLIANALSLIDELKPDILFTGQSSMGFGVDEIFMYIAKSKYPKIDTYTFLDFWGGGNSLNGALADDLFVFDECAQKHARIGENGDIHVVGSPRHQTVPKLDYAKERERLRENEKVGENSILITYFAQSAKMDGCYDNYTNLVNALSSVKEYKIVFKIKAHPKDDGESMELVRYAEEKGLSPEVLRDSEDNLRLLIASDLIFLCSSMIGMDHAYLSSTSNAPIGCVIYLSIGDKIKRYMLKNYGFDIIPLASVGMGYIAGSETDITEYINDAINDKLQKDYHKASKILSYKNSVEEIVNIIRMNLVES